MTDRLRRSSRFVCAYLAEAWRKRRYEAALVCELSDCDAQAAEARTGIRFAVQCAYLSRDKAVEIYNEYDAIIGMIVQMSIRP